MTLAAAVPNQPSVIFGLGLCSDPNATEGSHRTAGFSERLDIFRLHPVDPGQVTVSRFDLVQKMIQFRVDGLGISMSCALDKHGHHPCRKRGHRMPFEGRGRQDEPKCGIHRYHKENTGARREYAQSGEKSTKIGSHRTKRTHDCAYKFRKLASLCGGKSTGWAGFPVLFTPKTGAGRSGQGCV
jgi:hypothetical protein